MGDRPEIPAETQLHVRVWGMDADARPFSQNAVARNLSGKGAQILGISHPLKTGDIIGIKHGEKKARFKVAWVTDGGSLRKIEAGVQIVEGQESPWKEMTNPQELTFAPGKIKRRFVRHRIQFPIQIGLADTQRAQMNTNATDIGGRGCYVETLLPLPLGTQGTITFWMDDEKVQTTAVVRASDPGVGMGIEFTTLDAQIQERLQHFLDKMDTSPTPDEDPTETDPNAAS
ncbi:MAG: PilZ domain-containing protein [Candidatus Sulfotelmatobacter sp.]